MMNKWKERDKDEASLVYRIRNVVVRRSPSSRDLAAREVTAATRHRGSRDEANYDFVTFRLFIRPTCERTYILSEMNEIVSPFLLRSPLSCFGFTQDLLHICFGPLM